MNPTEEPVPEAEPTVPVPSQSLRPVPGNAARVMDWALIVIFAILAGLAAWQVGEYTISYAKLSPAVAENYRDSTGLNAEMPGVNSVNGALTFGALGGFVGLAMGLAGGVSRRSPASAILGAVLGLIIGAALGALPSPMIMPWQWRHRNDDPFNADLLMPFLIHLGLWTPLGLAAGLAFGIGKSGFNPPRLVEAGLAGLIGAVLGVFVFEVTGALFFPAAATTNPFSLTAGTRLLARLCIALFVGLGVIRTIPRARANRAA